MNVLCSAVSSQRADSVEIRGGLKEADKIRTPKAVSSPKGDGGGETSRVAGVHKSEAALS